MHPRSLFRAATALAVVLLLILVVVPGLGSAQQRASTTDARGARASAIGASSTDALRISPSTELASTAGSHPLPHSNDSTGCQARQRAYSSIYEQALPLDILHTLQKPCYIGHDEPGLNFVSNQSYSGSRVRFDVSLSVSGTNT